ncbi:uncharacterized protein LOC123200844 [Mangifera indica]|uniref:uncharacterized protein LOC123200844 n=1 Tax=Mangifera indica TaxID=29780 RepID=UPI001CFB061C|nr:uncharacterized protein LOC123200844 [Mangifera indica]
MKNCTTNCSHCRLSRKCIRRGIVELYPKGSSSRNSRWPKPSQGQRGGLEIVFNQQ